MVHSSRDSWSRCWSEPEAHDSGEDTFGFSFVDMVSGGFGAAFFLFLVFATLPLDSGSTPGGGDRFIGLWLTWEEDDETYEPILEYRPPMTYRGEAGSWRRYRLSEGTLSAPNEFGEVTAPGFRNKPFWTRLLAAGFSNAVSPALREYDTSSTQPERAGLWMHFADPCPGSYRVRINRNAGFQGHLADILQARATATWTMALTAPGQSADLSQVDAIDPTADGGLDALAPLVVVRPNEADEHARLFFVIKEPRKKGSDLDHCN